MIDTKDVVAAMGEALYNPDEVNSDGKSVKAGLPEPIMVEGITNTFAFHPDRLENTRERVTSWCNELKDDFFRGKGGGASFLNMRVTKKGKLWGQLRDCEALMCLAMGLKIMEYCLAKEFWPEMPGGVPYIRIDFMNSSHV